MPNDAVIILTMAGNGLDGSAASSLPLSVWFIILAYLCCFLHSSVANILFERFSLL